MLGAGWLFEILLGEAAVVLDLEGGELEGIGVVDRTAIVSAVTGAATTVDGETSVFDTVSVLCEGAVNVGLGGALLNPEASGGVVAGVSFRVGLADDCSPDVVEGGTVERIGGGGGVTRRNVGRT